MKTIMENWRHNISEVISPDAIQTVGDLRALIQTAQLKKRGEQLKSGVVDAAKSAIVDEIVGKIPGLATAKSLFDFARTAYTLPDESRTGTALDHLDVDDDVSKIVDDPIENAFLASLGKTLDELDDNIKLEDINMTQRLQKYIADNFNKRTVAGVTK
jgi:hypothetical protein